MPRRQPNYALYTEEQIKLMQITFANLRVAKLISPVQSQFKDRLASPATHQDSLLQKHLEKLLEMFLEAAMSTELEFYPLLINCLVSKSSMVTLKPSQCGTSNK